jgi:hypothetical protein
MLNIADIALMGFGKKVVQKGVKGAAEAAA